MSVAPGPEPSEVAAAYDATGSAWQHGPGRIYDELARRLVALSPVPLDGRTVVDLGAGTGAGSRALAEAGAVPVAVDVSWTMLAFDAAHRPPAAVGDARRLPFRDRCMGGVVAPFSLNHLTDPVAGLREAARVCAAGAPVLVSAYAEDDSHPIKVIVESAATRHGWPGSPALDGVRAHTVPLLATTERALAAATAAGLDAVTEAEQVAFAELGAAELVDWRLGLAQLAPFVARLSPARHAALRDEAIAAAEHVPVLTRSVIWICAVVQ